MKETLDYIVYQDNFFFDPNQLDPPFDYLFQNGKDLNEFIILNSNKICLTYNNQKLSQVLFMGDENPLRMLFVHDVRLSFQSKTCDEVLYDIFFSEGLTKCQAKLFRNEGNKLTFLQIENTNTKDSEEIDLLHHIFVDSYAKLQLYIFRFKDGLVIDGKDKYGNTSTGFSSWDLIEDPAERFGSYLHQMSLPPYQITQNIFLEKLSSLCEHLIFADPEIQDRICHLIKNSVPSIIPILTLRSYLQQRVISEQANIFIENLLLKCNSPSSPTLMNQSESIQHLIHKNILYFTMPDLTSQPSILISINIDYKELSKELIKSLLIHLYNTQNDHPSRHNRIEIMIKSESLEAIEWEKLFNQILDFKDIDFNKYVESLERITFIIQSKSASDYYTYISFQIPSGEFIFKEQKNLRHFNLNLIDNLEFYKINNVNEKNQALYSDLNSYIYHHECQYFYGENYKIDHLFGISVITSSNKDFHDLNSREVFQELDLWFSNLLSKIKRYFKENQTDTSNFNHILFDIISNSSIEHFEIKKFTDAIIKKYFHELIENKIYTISFKQSTRSNENQISSKTLIIKYQNNTGHYYKEVSSESSAIEIRRRKALQCGSIFAYDIPDLISYAANTFLSEMDPHPLKIYPSQDSFEELDVDPVTKVIDSHTNLIDCNKGELIPALDAKGNPRPYGQNTCGIVIGVHTIDLGIGMPVKRMLILGDLTHDSKGAITAEECLRINLAIKYAYEKGLPIDWFTASFGVEIHKSHGVENLDASASTCRDIVRYSQDLGVPINVVVCDVNIGAQSYWDALAAICQDTHSILIMTSKGTMSLTGHQALTSAFYKNLHSEDIPTYAKNLFPDGLQSLAGYEQIHGPNGEATNYAQSLQEACDILVQHHYYTYSKHFLLKTDHRPVFNSSKRDPIDRNMLEYTFHDHQISIQDELSNIIKGGMANRAAIIEALRDQNTPLPLYLWHGAKGIQLEMKKGCMPQNASTIVCEIILGSRPIMLIFPPLGPLTPLDSEIIARAIKKASGHLPVVILGNLAGFNSDPLSMQNKQLTQGASIVRAIVHFQGALVIINLGYMIGGAYVVFSKQLNPCIRILAVEGAKVQVVGGNIAAKIVFHSRICQQAKQDPRFKKLNHDRYKINESKDQVNALFRKIVAELENKEEVEFNQIHDVQRAKKVGSIDAVIAPCNLRFEIIQAIEKILEEHKGPETLVF